jgi:hypothetical protein
VLCHVTVVGVECLPSPQVGGFSYCPRLKAALRDSLRALVTTARPEGVTVYESVHHPELAVMRGSIMYALNPAVITHRCARFTYGIEVLTPFREVHDMAHLLKGPDGEEYCRSAFNVFVQKGQNVPTGHTVSHRFNKHSPTQTHATLKIFTAQTADPLYCDEPGTQHHATITLNMAADSQGLKVEFVFGTTELRCRAVDIATGVEECCSVLFQRDRAD